MRKCGWFWDHFSWLVVSDSATWTSVKYVLNAQLVWAFLPRKEAISILIDTFDRIKRLNVVRCRLISNAWIRNSRHHGALARRWKRLLLGCLFLAIALMWRWPTGFRLITGLLKVYELDFFNFLFPWLDERLSDQGDLSNKILGIYLIWIISGVCAGTSCIRDSDLLWKKASCWATLAPLMDWHLDRHLLMRSVNGSLVNLRGVTVISWPHFKLKREIIY